MRFEAPNERWTSVRSLGSVAIVSVRQLSQPPLHGVSVCGGSGYGLWAYASSRAPAAAMAWIQSMGDMPPVFQRGVVSPPANCACGFTVLIVEWVGLSV